MSKRKNSDGNLPVAIRYGKAIADAGWSAIPNILLDFVTYLRCTTPDGKVLKVNDQEAFFLVMLLRRKKDNEDPACRIGDVRTQAPYNTRRRWVAKLKTMGLLFSKQVYVLTGGGTPRLSHNEWDLENLLDNLLAVRQIWLQGRAEHRARGESGPYELPEDFIWEIQLFPSTAQRIRDEYYQWIPQQWADVAGEPPSDHQWSNGAPSDHQWSDGTPNDHQWSNGNRQLTINARAPKDTLQYLTVPLRVPYGAGDARSHLPLLDELSLDFTWEEQAEYVEFWLQRFAESRKVPAANTALAKAFGRAFGFQRDGELVVEPGQGEYAHLGGMAKEFQDLGGHVAVWRAACRMWGRDLQGDPLAYLAQSLIRERNERQEARREHGKQKQRRGAPSRSGARRSAGHGYRQLPDDAERDYLADPCVEGNRDEPESG